MHTTHATFFTHIDITVVVNTKTILSYGVVALGRAYRVIVGMRQLSFKLPSSWDAVGQSTQSRNDNKTRIPPHV